jgi:SEC-C motif-containing protein
MTSCYCDSVRAFDACCKPLIDGAPAPSAEALMRSRYSAYVVAAVDYLGETLHPAHRDDWDREATRRWATSSEWLGLEILEVEAGAPGDDHGWVAFAATFRADGETRRHVERSRFEFLRGRWYYVDGESPKPTTRRHAGPRVGRNDPCPCGSGKKYKRCCGA